MLEPIKHILSTKKIILASGSPRRKEILESVGLKFEICSSLYEENLDPGLYENHAEFVLDMAYRKVQEVADRLKNKSNKPDIILGADTIVSFDGKVLGKPKNEETAFKMLKELQGQIHTVYTGVVIHTPSKVIKFHESTKVYMSPLTESIIKGYINTGEPLDKAGAYGIQGIGGSLIEKIDGDYFTVMGLPLHKVCKHLVEVVTQ